MRRASVFFCVLPLCLAGCGGDSVSGGTPAPSGVPRLPVRWPELSRDIFVGDAARSVRFEVISDLGGQVVLSGDRPVGTASARVVLSGDRPLPAGPGRLLGFTFAGAGGSGARVGRLDLPITIVQGGELRYAGEGPLEFTTTRLFGTLVLNAPETLAAGGTARVTVSGRDGEGAVVALPENAGRLRVLSGPGSLAPDGTLSVTGPGQIELEARLEDLVARARVSALPAGTTITRISTARARAADGAAGRGFALLTTNELVGFSSTTGARESSVTVTGAQALSVGGDRVFIGRNTGQVEVRNAADGALVAVAGEPSGRVLTMDARPDGSAVVVGTEEFNFVGRLDAYGRDGATLATRDVSPGTPFFNSLALVGGNVFVTGGVSSGEVLAFPFGPEGFGGPESLRELNGFFGLKGNGVRAVTTRGVFGPGKTDFAPLSLDAPSGYDVDDDGTLITTSSDRSEVVLTPSYGTGTARRIPVPGSVDAVFAVGTGAYVIVGPGGTSLLRVSA